MKLYQMLAPIVMMTALVGCNKTEKAATENTASVTTPTTASNPTITASSGSATATATVASDMSPSDHKDARKRIMKQWGKANKTMGGMIKDPSKFNAEEFKAAAAKLDQDAWVHFPDNAKGGDSKDSVWTDKAGFQQQIDKYKTAVHALNTAAQTATSADMVKQPQADLSASCKSCHEKFKEED